MKMHPTTVRALLYFVIAFMTPFSDKVLVALYANQWPTIQIVLASSITGTLAGLIALRAYIDGSALRNKQDEETQTISMAKVTETVKTETSTPPTPSPVQNP